VTGAAAHSCAEFVEDNDGDGRPREHPEQPVAEVGAEDRVGGDAGRVVVGEAGENARPNYGGKGNRARVAAGVERQRAAARCERG
jgi:hypothetical protein